MLEKMFILGAAVLALTCAPTVSHAALIYAGASNVAITAGTSYEAGTSYGLSAVSDGTYGQYNASPGYVGTGSGTKNFVTTNFSPDYFANGGVPPVFTIDLGIANAGGGNVSINSAAFWANYANAGNSTSSFSLKFATAADGPSGFGTSITYNPTFTVAYPINLPSTNQPEQDFAFGQTITARYVQLTLRDNFYGTAPSGGDRVGMNEIQFNQVIPEPATIGLMALGGLMMIRGRR